LAKCQFQKRKGRTCSANAQVGKPFCVFHDPAMAAKVQKARRSGGLTRARKIATLAAETPDYPLGNTTDVSALLATSINQLLRRQLDPRIANAVGYLSSVLIRSLEQGSLEERIAKLEAMLGLVTASHELAPLSTATNDTQSLDA
jgi:hypothetical protein